MSCEEGKRLRAENEALRELLQESLDRVNDAMDAEKHEDIEAGDRVNGWLERIDATLGEKR
jgi:regulator of replication initiation timing